MSVSLGLSSSSRELGPSVCETMKLAGPISSHLGAEASPLFEVLCLHASQNIPWLS